MADSETLRQSIIQQSETIGTKRRFGLFSQPITTAVGDNGAYKKKLRNLFFITDPRDPSNNKPLTQPKNFYTSPIKSGRGNSGYFEPHRSLATSDVKD